MIRQETEEGWLLVRHQDHARLAGELAQGWGNAHFAPPEPTAEILHAVHSHDDGWARPDARPSLTRQGKPAAFSRDLVGTYAAFEEIDLADYLAVRGEAFEIVAKRNPYAALLVSLHTVNLLTEQADLGALDATRRELHADFVARQRRRQGELLEELKRDARLAAQATAEGLERGFRFLQACDSLSLLLCVDYDRPRPLRHLHPARDGSPREIVAHPLGGQVWRISPYPFCHDAWHVSFPAKRLTQKTWPSATAFAEAFAQAPVERISATLVA